jgi:L-iditol 2-dehydrogenase
MGTTAGATTPATSRATMRGLILRGARDVELVEVPRPDPGPGEVVLRVDAALTCGTDAKVYRRGYHARMLQPPCLFGHEYAGTVAAVGDGVTSVSEGDAVVGGNSAPCGRCDYCREGRSALCDDLLFVNGAFAEWMLLPERVVERNLHPMPAGLDPVVAAATEPVACVLKGIEMTDVRAGESVLILGSGPIGLVFAAEVAARGAHPVVFARSDEAAETARRMRAHDVVVASSVIDCRDELRAAAPGQRGYDVVIEAAGADETSQIAPSLCRKGGRVMLFGGCRSDVRVTWAPAPLHYDEIAILSSFHHTPRHVAASLEVLAEQRLDITPLLEAPVGLDGLRDVLERMCSRQLRGKVPVLPHLPSGA